MMVTVLPFQKSLSCAVAGVEAALSQSAAAIQPNREADENKRKKYLMVMAAALEAAHH
jgi:hypothetical protein